MNFNGRWMCNRWLWVLPVLLWTLLTGVSLHWNLLVADRHALAMATERGRNFFNAIQLVRTWNLRLGGVYAMVSEHAQPNPYLNSPLRDQKTTDGLALTLINDAYMTRQLSELAQADGLTFHITSDKPLRPENRPDSWESAAIAGFIGGSREHTELVERDGKPVFRYMAPLSVDARCLACHWQQGYRVGDVRGGISVDVDAAKIFQTQARQTMFTWLAHGIAWLLVLLAMFWFLYQQRMKQLAGEAELKANQALARMVTEDLVEANERLRVLGLDTVSGLLDREHFECAISAAHIAAVEERRALVLVFVEPDFFEAYSARFGHLEGDVCIKTLARLVEACVAQSDAVVGRYRGASVGALLPGVSIAEAKAIVEAIRSGVEEVRIAHPDSEVAAVMTVSIGYAQDDGRGNTRAEQLIRRTATAMFRAKQAGHNRVQRG